FVVSHDRDFLDQTVTKILAFEGDGVVEGYMGGYSDYLEPRGGNGSAPATQANTRKSRNKKTEKNASGKRTGETETAHTITSPKKGTGRKLSFNLQYELDTLPARIDALEKELGGLQRQLSDPRL